MNLLTILSIYIQTVVCEQDKRVITTIKYSKYSIIPTILHGNPAGDGQFPYLVSIKKPLYRLEPAHIVWRGFCGGSIFDTQKVLTAAHCFENDRSHYAKNPEILRIVAGSTKSVHVHDGRTETTRYGQWRKIKKVILHEYFHFPDHDIAIAYVDTPWVFNREVNYVRLATVQADYDGTCVAAGFGKTGIGAHSSASPILLNAIITIIPRLHCTLIWEMNMDNYVCTSTAITDVAKGDSGGPLVCMHTGDPAEVNAQGILVGVVSGKVIDKTSLFTRVSSYRTFISSQSVRVMLSDAVKIQASLNVSLCIILVVLLYHLFYCKVLKKIMQRNYF